METVSAERILSAARWRYATKRFDAEKKIPEDQWTALEDVLVLSPSSFGLQPWKFLVVRDPEVRSELVAASWGQTQVVDASHLVVFAAKHPLGPEDVHAHLTRSVEVRSVDPAKLAGFGKVVEGFLANPPYPLDLKEWASRQVYIALGMFMQAAALMGIDTCPMEGIDPAAYDRLLGLEGTGFFTVAACPAGYRHAEDPYATEAKVRFPKPRIIEYRQ